jgi:PPM family protein phosphatase
LVRDHNEDSVDFDAELGLVVLADGMGGYNAGEVASAMTTSSILAGMKQHWQSAHVAAHLDDPTLAVDLLQAEITRANRSVFERAQSDAECEGMGTTVVACLFHNGLVTVGYLGDSRLYRLRDDVLEQITRDHSVLQEQIDAGLLTKDEARLSQHKNLVTRALGIDPDEEGDMLQVPVEPGDLYLLCSDGLNDMLVDDEIHLTLSLLRVNLKLCAQQLIQSANDVGGNDNISVILVNVEQAVPAPAQE